MEGAFFSLNIKEEDKHGDHSGLAIAAALETKRKSLAPVVGAD